LKKKKLLSVSVSKKKFIDDDGLNHKATFLRRRSREKEEVIATITKIIKKN